MHTFRSHYSVFHQGASRAHVAHALHRRVVHRDQEGRQVRGFSRCRLFGVLVVGVADPADVAEHIPVVPTHLKELAVGPLLLRELRQNKQGLSPRSKVLHSMRQLPRCCARHDEVGCLGLVHLVRGHTFRLRRRAEEVGGRRVSAELDDHAVRFLWDH